MIKAQLITPYSSLTFATLHVLSYSSTVQVDSETFNVNSHQNGTHNKLSHKMKNINFYKYTNRRILQIYWKISTKILTKNIDITKFDQNS